MGRKTAWLLNFDAEEELARSRSGWGRGQPRTQATGYTPSTALRARFEALVERVHTLFRPGDVVLAEGRSNRVDADFVGRAWCPTPRAREALRRAGATVPPAPDVSVLCAVNHRRFNAVLGQTLPGARYAVTLDEVRAAIAGPSPSGQWLLKRPFGFAGRGRLKVDPARPGDLDRAQAWINASLRAGGGLQVEPFVERLGDFALHGHLTSDGDLALGEPTVQACDPTGAWIGSSRAAPGDLAPEERQALFEQAHLAAEALRRAGYHGPFGIDAFRYRDAAGRPSFDPRCEINARYSMGWAVGMGDLRPDVDDRLSTP